MSLRSEYRLHVWHLLAGMLPVLGALTASAHLSYIGRNFGTFSSAQSRTLTISGQTVPNNWGWADGTDADFAHTHEQRYFRFTLQDATTIQITVDALDPANLLPGFSIYSGLGKPNDYESDITIDYLATLPGPPKEGAFSALATFRMGREEDTTFEAMSTLTYVAHAADGTSANYGTAAGINGDSLPDGRISAVFTLAAGDYTLVIGGANFFSQSDATVRNITATIATVPEPSCSLLVLGGMAAGLARIRQRRWTP